MKNEGSLETNYKVLFTYVLLGYDKIVIIMYIRIKVQLKYFLDILL